MIQQRSKEWFEQRKGKVTGSIAGAILGLNPYMTREDVMRQKVREYYGADREFNGNVATAYGQFHEDGALRDLQLDMPQLNIQEASFYELDNWLGASPDGLIDDDAVLEIKCPYSQRDKNPPKFKSINEQPHYYAQIQVELLCTHRYKCYFFQWSTHGTQLEIVMRDQDWIDEYLPELREFYLDYLKEREMPYAGPYLEAKRKEVETLTAAKLIEEYDDLSQAIDQATERRKEVLAELVKQAKEKDAEICGRKLTKVTRKGSISYSKLMKENFPKFNCEPYRGKSSEYWKLS
jgi:putative phage-type endonuclease